LRFKVEADLDGELLGVLGQIFDLSRLLIAWPVEAAGNLDHGVGIMHFAYPRMEDTRPMRLKDHEDIFEEKPRAGSARGLGPPRRTPIEGQRIRRTAAKMQMSYFRV
jgi:hypothetical protein